MNYPDLLMCGLIVVARIADVSMGTLRTICVVQGRAKLAWFTGFIEILIWIFAVSQVVQNLSNPLYALSYAVGYATGNYAGVILERRLALGRQVVRIFSRKGAEIASQLRSDGFRVTEFEGKGRSGRVDLLFIEAKRKDADRLARKSREVDSECFYVVDDVREASGRMLQALQPTGWRAILKKK